MIKRLLLLTALLAPGLAYGANPSNDFSVQIVPAGSGTGGGSGSGSGGGSGGGGSTVAPAAALAGCQTANGGGPSDGSCFSSQIVNMDFSGATQSYVGPSGNFNASSVSNWLSASGCSPSNPVFYASKTGGYTSGAAPCSDYNVVSDPLDGQASLRITMTPTDLDTNNIGDVDLTTMVSGHPGVLIPASSFYYSYQWHTDATSIANLKNAISQVPGLYPFTSALNFLPMNNWTVSYNGSGVGGFEWDATENHVPTVSEDVMGFAPSSYGHFYDDPQGCETWWSPSYNGSDFNPCQPDPPNSTEVSTYNPSTNWVTIQGRMTSDSSGNWAGCAWVNGVAIPCYTGTWNNNSCGGASLPCNSIIGAVSGILLWGPSDMWATPGPQAVLQGPINAYFRNLQVWTCPAAVTAYSTNNNTNAITISASQPNPCAGAVLTTNP